MKQAVFPTVAIAFFIGLLLISACSPKGLGSYPQIRDTPLVVVAHDEKGLLKDFRVIKDLTPIRSIIVGPLGNEKEIYVTLLGTHQHELLQKDQCVGTKVAAGFRGNIEIVIQQGLAVSVMGNSIRTPSPISRAVLVTISSKMAEGQLLPPDKSLIKIQWAERAGQSQSVVLPVTNLVIIDGGSRQISPEEFILDAQPRGDASKLIKQDRTLVDDRK